MAVLTEERKLLLDKLYNLRSDDSIIITGLKTEISDLEKAKSTSEEEKKQEEENKEKYNNELAIFTNQADTFLNSFSEFDDSSFESLKDVGVDVPVGTLLAKLRDKMPTHKGEIDHQITTSLRAIAEKESEIDKLINELEDAESRLNTAEADQSKLNLLLNDILVLKNNSYNRDFVKSVLDAFKVFTEEEILVLEFLILFPENGLIEYDQNYPTEEHKNPFTVEENVEKNEQNDYSVEQNIINQPVEIVNDTPTAVQEPSETPVIEENEPTLEVAAPIVNDIPTIENMNVENEPTSQIENQVEEPIIPTPLATTADNIFNPDFTDFVQAPVEEYITPETPVSNDEEPNNNNDVEITRLELLGVEIDKIPEANKDEIIKKILETDEKIITQNLNLLKSLNVPASHLYDIKDGFMYLTDSELSRKIDILKSRQISDDTITNELLNWNFTESYQTFAERIEALETTEEKITDQNIGKLKSDIVSYYVKILKLSEQGIELEDKEIRNNEAVLMNSPYVTTDADILKNHSIKLVRKNGKFALETFWKTPTELTSAIETLYEADLSKLIETNPEILGKNPISLLRRIKYCQEQNIPIVDENNQYYKYIYDELEFQKAFGNAVLPNLISTKEQIPNVIGNSDYIKILIDYLDAYYQSPQLEKIDFENSELLNEYNKIITSLPTTLKAQIINENIYNVSGTLISKSKLERNIAVLVDMLSKQNQAIDGLEREIILTAAMYNLHVTTENLDKIASSCLGFNKTSKRMGGLAA